MKSAVIVSGRIDFYTLADWMAVCLIWGAALKHIEAMMTEWEKEEWKKKEKNNSMYKYIVQSNKYQ